MSWKLPVLKIALREQSPYRLLDGLDPPLLDTETSFILYDM